MNSNAKNSFTSACRRICLITFNIRESYLTEIHTVTTIKFK